MMKDVVRWMPDVCSFYSSSLSTQTCIASNLSTRQVQEVVGKRIVDSLLLKLY